MLKLINTKILLAMLAALYILDAGHFALDAKVDEIAALVACRREFVTTNAVRRGRSTSS